MKRITHDRIRIRIVHGLLALRQQHRPQRRHQDQSSLGDYARKIRKDPGTAKAQAEGL